MMIIVFIVTFLASLIIAWVSIPAIIKVAEQKHLYDEPDELRKIHIRKVPTLGGIAIFAGTVISATFFAHHSKNLDLGTFLSAITILFFTGIKDDIIPLTPYKKFLAQLLAVCIVVFWGDVQLSSLYGFFFTYETHPIILYAATIFTMIVIINAFNLIDGINGLAGGIACIVISTFGIWFFRHNEESLAIWAMATCGATLGFLRYNFVGKIFMGDTGSLILGFISAVFAIKFIEMNKTEVSFVGGKAPLFAIAILVIPLFDTLRVFLIRIAHGKSPFSGDRNHLHHLLLDVGCTHLQASFVLYGLNVLVIVAAYFANLLNVYVYFAILFAIMLSFTQVLLSIRKRKNAEKNIHETSKKAIKTYPYATHYEKN
ncbi:MAG: undecaprenyl/decaprenyl-phosphate alpha-N-acetylglucosaminyl 1-phosphate transferase [Raineya sp.]|nr:undecaprenyl/decaprenyl-phosphate alpha-N-acetylglucosaminyl 1-phosphate transferase [Raineya sp.]